MEARSWEVSLLCEVEQKTYFHSPRGGVLLQVSAARICRRASLCGP